MAHIDEIIAFNQQAPRARPEGLSVDAKRELCIVTCVDPRLVRFFPLALGIERGDAVLIRLPGAAIRSPDGEGIRAVAAAVYINHAREFVVLGHTDCGTTRLDPAAVTSEMQRRGVPPSSMPGGPREFLGAISDMRRALLSTAQLIRSAPFVPNDVLVHAAILDIANGALEIIERGEPFVRGPGASGDALGYTPGSVQTLSSSLGDGASHLLSQSATSLFDGSSALAPAADPFAMPPPPPGFEVAAVPPPPEVAVPAAPPPAAPPPAKPPPAPARSKAPPRHAAPHNPNLEKVRDFYRLEFSPEERRRIARTLVQAASQGAPSAELVKLVVKPVLDMGQKRYRVIDEVISVKEQASSLPPKLAFELLSQLFD